jgi:hypothetical protein
LNEASEQLSETRFAVSAVVHRRGRSYSGEN